MSDLMEKLLRNNADYAKDFDKGDLPVPPALRLAVVTCMDARIDAHRILGVGEGDAHIIRNAGGVISDDALRSLLISQRLLNTREIMVIQHTGCGMLTFKDDEVKDDIEAETGLRPAFALEAFSDLKKNVRQSLRRIAACPFLPHKDRARGFVYNTENGRLEEVDGGEK